MTAKQLLHERIEELTEEEAIDWLGLFEESRPADREPLTPEEIAHIERGLADLREGRKVPHEEVLRRFGISQ